MDPREAAGELHEPELKAYIRLLIRRAWIIGLLAVLFCGGAYAQHKLYAVPSYEATTKVIVKTSRPVEGVSGVDVNQITSDIMLIDTYKEILMTSSMMEKVVAKHPEFGLTDEELRGKLQVGSTEKSQVMTLSVEDSSAIKAAAIVNAVTEVFREEIPKILNVDNINILSQAKLTDRLPDRSLSLTKKLMAAVALSLVCSIGLIFLREYWDDKIRTEKDVFAYLGKPTLARVSRIKASELRGSAGASQKNVAGDSLHVGVNQQA
ncbi:YveK family protein [Cohnella nanjingensis]|uniref:Lipopolysaccharide biosynthesis protein n=1 Tax=Cohnella nanjingensis TaxID=1387779 RepID=A0A7X0RQN5_9BACL|nr:Wzz/FepE/Etk N-terminal domain-containing protein [Cohnella nanjingensis]MBB6671698.1 lipopolysaccharide biosynthesis protein [Cohnella nanjingensis]